MSGLYLGSTKINDVRVATDTANALADMISALTEKEVKVPSGTDITDIAGLIRAIETSSIISGSFTLGSNTKVYQIEHNLGRIPTFVAVIGDTVPLKTPNYATTAAWAINDNINVRAYMSTGADPTYVILSSSGVSMQKAYDKFTNKNSAFYNANVNTVDFGADNVSAIIMAGVTYHWFIW